MKAKCRKLVTQVNLSVNTENTEYHTCKFCLLEVALLTNWKLPASCLLIVSANVRLCVRACVRAQQVNQKVPSHSLLEIIFYEKRASVNRTNILRLQFQHAMKTILFIEMACKNSGISFHAT